MFVKNVVVFLQQCLVIKYINALIQQFKPIIKRKNLKKKPNIQIVIENIKDHNCPKSDNPYQAICNFCEKEFKTKKGFDMHRCKEIPRDKLGELIKNKS